MSQLNEVEYIDTREGAKGLFACPPGEQFYTEWLEFMYKASYKEGHARGVAQRIDALIYRAKREGVELIAIGRSAGAAASFIEKLSKHQVIVTVV